MNSDKNNRTVERQTRLGKGKIKYSYGPYNKIKGNEQWIRISEGCPNDCPFCNEPTKFKIFDIPEIKKEKVKLLDMNLLAKPEAHEKIYKLSLQRVDGNLVEYEFLCGIDFRYLTEEMAREIKNARFVNIRMAWDWEFKFQYKIKDAIKHLTNVGYTKKDITIFIICNWKIPYEMNCRKLDLCKVWNVKVVDCWFDNQTSPNIQPIHWQSNQIKDFRKRVRKHNQLVNFGIDPEVKA